MSSESTASVQPGDGLFIRIFVSFIMLGLAITFFTVELIGAVCPTGLERSTMFAAMGIPLMVWGMFALSFWKEIIHDHRRELIAPGVIVTIWAILMAMGFFIPFLNPLARWGNLALAGVMFYAFTSVTWEEWKKPFPSSSDQS